MPRSLNLPKLKLPSFSLRDPRMAMRGVAWTLIALNLAAALAAFTPLGGGSGEALQREESDLRVQLADLNRRIVASRGLARKVETARLGGDDFFNKYVMDARTFSSLLDDELNRAAKTAGIQPLASQTQQVAIEGSDTIYMAEITGGYEGNYAGIKKFVEVLDKSPRFLIIETMAVTAPQTQSAQTVTVTLKMDAFVRIVPGAAL